MLKSIKSYFPAKTFRFQALKQEIEEGKVITKLNFMKLCQKLR